MAKTRKAIWEWKIIRRAILDAFLKLNPHKMMGNPVMFVVEIGSVITAVLLFKASSALKFNLQITLWLWFTVLFANFAAALTGTVSSSFSDLAENLLCRSRSIFDAKLRNAMYFTI